MPGDDIGPDGLTDQQRAAGLAPRRHSVEAGVRGNARPLAEPLSEAELRTGGGYGPAITDVDCTPRPRYGESRAKFEARMRGYGLDMEALNREVRQRNRAAALRVVLHSGSVEKWASVESAVQSGRVGVAAFFTECACGFCGLRVADPEVARREYDAHTCAAETIGDDAVTRAQAHAGKATMPAKRTAAVLKPALVEQRGDQQPTVFAERSEVVRSMLDKTDRQDLDDFEQRVQLLDLGTKP